MAVTVMQVGKMGMVVQQGDVAVYVRVRLAFGIVRAVVVAMVFIM